MRRMWFLFQVRVDHLTPRWSFSLMVGVLGFSPEKYTFPVSSMAIKKSCIMIQGNAVYNSGCKVGVFIKKSCNDDTRECSVQFRM